MNPEQLQNTSNLTPAELDSFLKLPKDQQEKEKDERLENLKILNDRLDLAIQEGLKTGKPEEAQRLLEELRQGVQDLGQEIEATEIPEAIWPELPFKYEKMLIIPDPEITSAETAISKLEAQGHRFHDYKVKDMLSSVDWKEKLDPTYEIVSFSVSDLFGDKKPHTYADIKAKAGKYELKLIPAALAPSIRLNYDEKGTDAVVAMDPLRGFDNNLKLFYCFEFDSRSCLGYDKGSADTRWFDDSRFFFARKNSAESPIE